MFLKFRQPALELQDHAGSDSDYAGGGFSLGKYLPSDLMKEDLFSKHESPERVETWVHQLINNRVPDERQVCAS